MEKVFIHKQPDYEPEGVRAAAREIISQSGVDPKGKSVLLKPSFVYPSHSPETVAIVTQPPFIRGVALALSDLGASCVMVGEDSVIGPSRSAFYAMGVYKYIRGVAKSVYFDEVRHEKVRVPDAVVQDEFVVPAIWREADLFVSLPKIKVNQFAKVTLSVKNNLGFLRQTHRCVNHSDGTLQEKIADLYRVRPPDLVLADSIVAGEGQGPMLASPVELGVMVGGANGVAVDSIACALMGFEPGEIDHLRYLEEAGVGPLARKDIEIVGESVESVARDFKRPSTDMVGVHPEIRFFGGEEKCCGNGCKGMIRCGLDAWLERRPETMREMNIIAGKGVDPPRDLDRRRTLVVGDCAAEHAHLGRYLPGCPPLPMDTAFTIQKYQGLVPTPLLFRDVIKGYVAGYGWKAARFFSGHGERLEMGE